MLIMPLGKVYGRDRKGNAKVRLEGIDRTVILKQSYREGDIQNNSIILVQANTLTEGDHVYFSESSLTGDYRLATPQEIAAFRSPQQCIDLILNDEPRFRALVLGKWKSLQPSLKAYAFMEDEGTYIDRMYGYMWLASRGKLPPELIKQAKKIVPLDVPTDELWHNSLLGAITLPPKTPLRIELEQLISKYLN